MAGKNGTLEDGKTYRSCRRCVDIFLIRFLKEGMIMNTANNDLKKIIEKVLLDIMHENDNISPPS